MMANATKWIDAAADRFATARPGPPRTVDGWMLALLAAAAAGTLLVGARRSRQRRDAMGASPGPAPSEPASSEPARLPIVAPAKAADPIAAVLDRKLDPTTVRTVGRYTIPRTFGVYELREPTSGRRFRFGNHPIRQRELMQQHGRCIVQYLFTTRDDAVAVASWLNEG